MTGNTQLLGGITAGVASAALLYSDNILLSGGAIALSAVGGLMPDIDHPLSKAGKKAGIFSVLINRIFGHRGLLHTPFFLFVSFFIFYLFLNQLNLSFYYPLLFGYCIGYTSHLFLDSITVSGIPLLYPFYKKKKSLIKMKTGGMGEYIIGALLLIMFSGFLILYLIRLF